MNSPDFCNNSPKSSVEHFTLFLKAYKYGLARQGGEYDKIKNSARFFEKTKIISFLSMATISIGMLIKPDIFLSLYGALFSSIAVFFASYCKTSILEKKLNNIGASEKYRMSADLYDFGDIGGEFRVSKLNNENANHISYISQDGEKERDLWRSAMVDMLTSKDEELVSSCTSYLRAFSKLRDKGDFEQYTAKLTQFIDYLIARLEIDISQIRYEHNVNNTATNNCEKVGDKKDKQDKDYKQDSGHSLSRIKEIINSKKSWDVNLSGNIINFGSGRFMSAVIAIDGFINKIANINNLNKVDTNNNKQENKAFDIISLEKKVSDVKIAEQGQNQKEEVFIKTNIVKNSNVKKLYLYIK